MNKNTASDKSFQTWCDVYDGRIAKHATDGSRAISGMTSAQAMSVPADERWALYSYIYCG